MQHFILKIKLKYVSKPPVWRRVVVPANLDFHRLHLVIQSVMPWEDYHLYDFTDAYPYGSLDDKWRIAIPDDEDDWFSVPCEDSRLVEICSYLEAPGDKMIYTYDFGDSWTHSIELEEITDLPKATMRCLAGKGACPPEDVGGASGYQMMKEVFATDPHGDEAQSYREWLLLDEDEEFDPKAFDIDEANDEIDFRVPKRKPARKSPKAGDRFLS